MATLHVVRGNNVGQTFPLGEGKTVLGRQDDCDIILNSAQVSRQHAQIIHSDGAFYLEDLKSRNHTFLNGEKVLERCRLEDNDEISLCDYIFLFVGRNNRVSPNTALDFVVQWVDDPKGLSDSVLARLDASKTRDTTCLAVDADTRLKALVEVYQNLGATLGVTQVLSKLLDSLLKIFGQAERGFVLLRDRDSDDLVPTAVKRRSSGANDPANEPVRITRTIIAQVMQEKKAILSADAASDPRFSASSSISALRLRSVMCAPLIDAFGEPLGAIQIDMADSGGRFEPGDLELFTSIVCPAALAIQNAQLHEEAVRQRVMQQNLDSARRVQMGLLPSAPPHVDGYEFYSFYQAADRVGGDYFNYVPLSDGCVAIVLADVSGHGMSAALLTAKLSSDVSYSLAMEADACAAVERLNKNFGTAEWQDHFITLVVAVLNPRAHCVSIVNAGHMPPFLRRRTGQVELVGDGMSGLPLGIEPDANYRECNVTMERGDSLVLFTDGISDAMDASGDMYGIARLRTQLGSSGADVGGVGQQVLNDVKSFTREHPQADDRCLVCLGRQT